MYNVDCHKNNKTIPLKNKNSLSNQLKDEATAWQKEKDSLPFTGKIIAWWWGKKVTAGEMEREENIKKMKRFGNNQF